MRNTLGARSLLTVCLQITILMETAYTEQIYPLIQNIDMRGLELFYMELERNCTLKWALKRMIAGGRLYNYCEHAGIMSPLEYAHEVVAGRIHDPVSSFELDNGFKFIKILPNYLSDVRSLNYASL